MLNNNFYEFLDILFLKNLFISRYVYISIIIFLSKFIYLYPCLFLDDNFQRGSREVIYSQFSRRFALVRSLARSLARFICDSRIVPDRHARVYIHVGNTLVSARKPS